jgi:phenylalanyl-tRNA synthetase beta chain
MKLCESWIKTWTKQNLSPQELIDIFTMAGLEVSDWQMAAPDFKNVVVAEVIETKPHPKADKLTICQVNNGDQVVQIVCGAANVRVGLKVALAKPGALLPGGLEISEATLRGEPSFGMLCSTVELGCAESSDGIWELPKDAPIGMDLRQYFEFNEHVFGFELTPNRGDCFSAIGLARELAALTKQDFLPLNISPVKPVHDETIPVSIADDVLCPRYCGRYIKGIRPHAITPSWLRERLRRIGLRPVHAVVDVLNYVMFYLGQPMHAFDLHKIERNITVRRAGIEESITLLNGKVVVLEPGTPLITDTKGPIAIAGVMGSADSAVDDDTVDIFLESAFFNPISIAGVARRYGLSTDASIRYERGVDPTLAVDALEFATDLLLSIVGGAPGPVQILENIKHLPPEVRINFHPDNFLKRTGVCLPIEQMQSILESLHFKVSLLTNNWEIVVPSYRFDIQSEVDLIEEILRVYGYKNIPSIPLTGELRFGQIDGCEQKQRLASLVLKDLGYSEAIHYAFVDPKIQSLIHPGQKTIDLLNPISPELSQMRQSLWTGLITSLIYNTNRQQQSLQLFEAGVIFHKEEQSLRETFCLAGVLYGEKGALNWATPESTFDFFDAKGHIEHLLEQLGYESPEFVTFHHEALHPGQSATIRISGMECGQLGALHPRYQKQFDLLHSTFLWHLNLDGLPLPKPARYEALSKFPQTRRDLSFLVSKNTPVGDVIKAICKVIPRAILRAIACILQPQDKTFIESDIMAYQEQILKVLKKDFGIQLRGGNECIE